ncbi:HAD family hydrolase [Anaerotardibacter muris]|uniref:HAD family hydrolase n=1 Tax=Anaerotardibacter muris TaxID=2941505 RepID=UPI00203CC117|nr:HAD family hydrolase [Anaerotardibacter muris]
MCNQPAYKAFIFDLDGTLLNTLPDLVNVTNKALEEEGFPTHTPEQILTYIGDGAASLISQAVPSDASQEEFERTFKRFKDFYHDFGILYTTEFEGMSEALQQAKAAGVKLAIMSNKFEQGVLDVRDRFFPDLIDVAHGESAQVPRKPDPTGILLCAEELGIDPAECLFFGDSASDIEAGHNAGMKSVAVKWGYQPHERLMAANPDYVLERPEDMLVLAGL